MMNVDTELSRELLAELVRTPRGLWVTCVGRSMEPTVRMGDRVEIRSHARLWPGDVVLFQGARGLVLHRVLYTVPGTPWFLHIGDAGSEDGPGLARRDSVLGRAAVPWRPPPLAAYARSVERLARAAYRVTRRALGPGPRSGPRSDV